MGSQHVQICMADGEELTRFLQKLLHAPPSSIARQTQHCALSGLYTYCCFHTLEMHLANLVECAYS